MRLATIARTLALGALAPLALAQTAPPPGSAHVLTVDYAQDQAILLQGALGYQIAIEFGGDERIESVALGDSGAWQVTANKRGDHLFVKPLQGGVSTNMVVVTDRRLYTFDLAPFFGPPDQLIYAVRFHYPPPAAGNGAGIGAVVGYYHLSGDRAIRPGAISDDGVHTYIQWSASVALPAVYALDADGREALANGAMRDGTYTIDSVSTRLVFRRDARVAYAARRVPKAR